MPRRNNHQLPPKRQLPRGICLAKRSFATRERAVAVAHNLQKLHDSDQPQRSYLCADCGKWHLTSKGAALEPF